MAIEWFEEQPNGEVIEDLKAWRRTIDALPNPIHQFFYEFILATGLRKTEAFTLEWKHVHLDRLHIPVILPVLRGRDRRIHATILSFIAGVTAPIPILGRSLL